MKLINSYNIKYANHLFDSESLVLRGDEMRGDFPILNIYSNDKLDIVLTIKEGINTESMNTNPNEGAKFRVDIHTDKEALNKILFDLNQFKIHHGLVMDTQKYDLHDPSGTEHSNGLSLGNTKPLSRIPVRCSIMYRDINKAAVCDMIYIDAEHYRSGMKRYHIGGKTTAVVDSNAENMFEIVIPKKYVVRFIKTIELGIILLK
ncbi:hypothetical protein PT089_02810 [Erysipelothrix rhusiopathiae]|nr:hypothetical protein [Erysipelothrix rhusiopathiae]